MEKGTSGGDPVADKFTFLGELNPIYQDNIIANISQISNYLVNIIANMGQ